MSLADLGIRLPAIAPSILTADFTDLGNSVVEAERNGAGLLHLDVMDGRFVPNITFGPPIVAALRPVTAIPFDVHLMIDEPERYVDAFAEAGANIITVHAEATRHLHRALQQIHAQGIHAGVAINPATPVTVLEDVLGVVDLVLVMSVNPGFGGQTFIPSTIGKLARVRSMLETSGHNTLIEVDGGIQPSNARRVTDAGADILVAGSSVYSPERSVAESMSALLASIRS